MKKILSAFLFLLICSLFLLAQLGLKKETTDLSQLVPKEDFDLLFNKIIDASLESYNSGDWSTFAKLYDPSSSCYVNKTKNDYAFLSMMPFQPNATYEMVAKKLGKDSRNDAQYIMKINGNVAYQSRCNVSGVGKRGSQNSFDVIVSGAKLLLANNGVCPLENTVADERPAKARKAATSFPRLISKKEYEKAISLLTQEDWNSVPEQIKKDKFPLQTIYRVRNKYKLNFSIASMVVHHICDVNNTM